MYNTLEDSCGSALVGHPVLRLEIYIAVEGSRRVLAYAGTGVCVVRSARSDLGALERDSERTGIENDSSIVDNSSNTNILSLAVSNNCATQGTKTIVSVLSKTCGDAALNLKSNTSTVEKYKPKKFVRQSDKCACTCGNSGKQKQSFNRYQQTSHGPRPSPNHIVLKRQTCFNCGTPGHVARNCPHRPYVPYYAQNWQNMPRRKSSKIGNSSRSCSSDGDWNTDKAKNQASRDMKNKNHDSRDAFIKPKWVRSKSSQGSSYSSHLKFKPKAKGSSNSTGQTKGLSLITDGFPKSLLPNHLTILLLIYDMSWKKFPVLMVMVNPVTKWTGLQKPINPAACAGATMEEYIQTLWLFHEHDRRHISTARHSEHLWWICVLRGKRRKKGKITQMGTVENGVLKKVLVPTTETTLPSMTVNVLDLYQSGIQIQSLHVKDVIHYHRDSLRHSVPTDDAPSYTTHC
ncbi:hypothetical protein LXL04_039582 [Taraxacum kok-saghyz]